MTDRLVRHGVPEDDAVVPSRRQDRLTVRTEHRFRHRVGMSPQKRFNVRQALYRRKQSAPRFDRIRDSSGFNTEQHGERPVVHVRRRFGSQAPRRSDLLALVRHIHARYRRNRQHSDEHRSSPGCTHRLAMQANIFAVQIIFRPPHQRRGNVE